MRAGRYTETFRIHHRREMGTGRADGPRRTHHTIRGEDKVSWQEVEGEREKIGV